MDSVQMTGGNRRLVRLVLKFKVFEKSEFICNVLSSLITIKSGKYTKMVFGADLHSR